MQKVVNSMEHLKIVDAAVRTLRSIKSGEVVSIWRIVEKTRLADEKLINDKSNWKLKLWFKNGRLVEFSGSNKKPDELEMVEGVINR